MWWMATNRNQQELTRLKQMPYLDDAPTDQLVPVLCPSKEHVSRILSQGAYSIPVTGMPGVDRYDGSQLASSNPCEDRFIHGALPSPRDDGGRWATWAIFDGHSGWQTADLLPFVRNSLGQAKSALGKESAATDAVQDAIIRAFVRLDDAIIKSVSDIIQSNAPLQDKLVKLMPGYAGSCALLSMYDPLTSTLHVACTGDSRAVLGRKRPDGTWEAVGLSLDQTGHNAEEVARLKREHPGEDNIVTKDGLVLGHPGSRALGDGRWKWPLDLQPDLRIRFNSPAVLPPSYRIRTPPYLTAEPVVTSTKIDISQPCFLIMASGGLWHRLSSENAVNLVGKWWDLGAPGKGDTEPEPTYETNDFHQLRSLRAASPRFFEERMMTFKDDNAAVHLTRNALGGNHHGLVATQLAYNSPFSRWVRDDITVQVVFFGNRDATKAGFGNQPKV
ncbi:phosphatase 2C-like domain-containing protein [Chaetomium sp. MPI-CAGE-AT-0009]|nr:phosphatase 2C-like domain-containing protein [Chaetomium sp. MPI-CAGE-AT-0009]